MCIITDVFAHHVSYGSSFFIIPFSPTSIHHVISHYHIRLSGHSAVVSFVSLVSSGPRIAAQLDFVLVSVFTALCVIVQSSGMSVRLFSLSRHRSARFYFSRCSQRRVSLLGRLVCWSWIFAAFSFAPWLASFLFDHMASLLVSAFTPLCVTV